MTKSSSGRKSSSTACPRVRLSVSIIYCSCIIAAMLLNSIIIAGRKTVPSSPNMLQEDSAVPSSSDGGRIHAGNTTKGSYDSTLSTTTTTTTTIMMMNPVKETAETESFETSDPMITMKSATDAPVAAAATTKAETIAPTKEIQVPLSLQSQFHANDVVRMLRKLLVDYNTTNNNNQHSHNNSNVTVAVCYKTLFGTPDLGLVLQWIAYHYALGFDHFFFWYRPEVMTLPGFAELLFLQDQHKIVTLTENVQGKRKKYFNQIKLEAACLSNPEYANSYDWVMLADIDEYLWLAPSQSPSSSSSSSSLQNGGGIKEFIQQHAIPSNWTYMSFGKWMYTLDHRIITTNQTTVNQITTPTTTIQNHVVLNTSLDGFVLSSYPYYIPNFCYHRDRPGAEYCPTWKGRSKVIVNPKAHHLIKTHGAIHKPEFRLDAHHFDTNVAHFKEWPHIFIPHNVTLHYPQQQRQQQQQHDNHNDDDDHSHGLAHQFTVTEEDQVHIHNLKNAFKPNENGSWTVTYDVHLQEWFDQVKSRYGLLDGRGK